MLLGKTKIGNWLILLLWFQENKVYCVGWSWNDSLLSEIISSNQWLSLLVITNILLWRRHHQPPAQHSIHTTDSNAWLRLRRRKVGQTSTRWLPALSTVCHPHIDSPPHCCLIREQEALRAIRSCLDTNTCLFWSVLLLSEHENDDWWSAGLEWIMCADMCEADIWVNDSAGLTSRTVSFLVSTSQLAVAGHHWYCWIHCIMQAFFVLSFLQCQTKNFHFIQLYVPNKIIFRHCILYKESKYWIAARWIEEFRYELANTRWNCFKLLERLLGCGGNSLESESLREEKNFPEIRLIFPGESLPPS